MSKKQYHVQYLRNDAWLNVSSIPQETYGEALERLTDESTNDPQFTHRVVEVISREVAYIEKRGIEE